MARPHRQPAPGGRVFRANPPPRAARDSAALDGMEHPGGDFFGERDVGLHRDSSMLSDLSLFHSFFQHFGHLVFPGARDTLSVFFFPTGRVGASQVRALARFKSAPCRAIGR